jgi:hypothetical protein
MPLFPLPENPEKPTSILLFFIGPPEVPEYKVLVRIVFWNTFPEKPLYPESPKEIFIL